MKEFKCKELLYFTKICNLSLTAGSLPEDWKVVTVPRIFKKGYRRVPGNYRTVSLTFGLSKLVDSITKAKITKHIGE